VNLLCLGEEGISCDVITAGLLNVSGNASKPLFRVFVLRRWLLFSIFELQEGLVARILSYIRSLTGATSSFRPVRMHVLCTLLQLSSYRSNGAAHSLEVSIIIIVAVYVFSSLATTAASQPLHTIVIFSIVRLDLNFRRSSRYVLVALLLGDGGRASSPLLRASSFALHMVR
jgi:hypothetical protein